MIFQTTPGVRREWAKDGCYVHSIVYEVARRHPANVVSVDRINDEIYPDLLREGLIRSDCYVVFPSEVFHYLGLPVAFVGKFGRDRVCKEDEFEINLWHYEPRNWYHFVNGDGFGVTTFDPWGISTTATHGRLVGKRIFQLL